MSFEISWHVAQRVLYVHVLGEMDLEKVEAMAKAVSESMQDGIAPVHILLDDEKGGRPPISLKDMKARLEIASHPSMGWIIGIGEVDAVAKFLIPLLMKLAKLNHTRVKTLQEALEYLARIDPTLEISEAKP